MQPRIASEAMRGITLVELLVTMVIALVVLGGLVLAFQSQYGSYKYQQRRADAVQDIESVFALLKDDLDGALIEGANAPVDIYTDPATGATTDAYLRIWEPDLRFWASAAQRDANAYRAERHWQFDPKAQSLRLDRNTRDGSDRPTEVLSDVTYFRIWRIDCSFDPKGVCQPNQPQPSCANGQPFVGAPALIPAGSIYNARGDLVQGAPVYAALVEVKVPVGFKGAAKKDHCGQPTPEPRVVRYLVGAPQTAVAQ